MRNIPCYELRKGDMIESELPMSIGMYIKSMRKTTIKYAERTGNLPLAMEYYWDQIMGRIELYRRDSEISYAINLADKQRPIDYKWVKLVLVKEGYTEKTKTGVRTIQPIYKYTKKIYYFRNRKKTL